MSTTDFLNNLTLSQLIWARDKADEMINKIEEEGRTPLVIVEGMHTNEACFLLKDFQKAKDKLCDLIQDDEFTAKMVRCSHPKLTMHRVPSREVDSWLELNNGK